MGKELGGKRDKRKYTQDLSLTYPQGVQGSTCTRIYDAQVSSSSLSLSKMRKGGNLPAKVAGPDWGSPERETAIGQCLYVSLFLRVDQSQQVSRLERIKKNRLFTHLATFCPAKKKCTQLVIPGFDIKVLCGSDRIRQ